MSGFTPGPWRVEEGTTLIWGACIPDDLTSYAMGVPICEARHWQSAAWERQRHPMTDAEIDANARLIAAAPELYEAAKAVEAWVADLGGFAEDGTQPAAVFGRLSAALAKARGEQA